MKKSNYNLHLQTQKHRRIGPALPIAPRESPSNGVFVFYCEKCDRPYKTRSGVWKHQTACEAAERLVRKSPEHFDEKRHFPTSRSPENFELSKCEVEDFPTSLPAVASLRSTENFETEGGLVGKSSEGTMLAMIYDLVKQNQEIKELLMKQTEQIQEYTARPVIIQQHIQNNTTNNFSLNVFLHEKCKGAINMSDFVKNLTIEMGDLEMVGKIGYVEGISRIIMNELSSLDIYTRPIHCTDTKRETIYIKDHDIWTRDTDTNEHTKKVIEKVANKNLSKIPEWRRQHPGADIMDSKEHELNMNIMIQSLGGLGGTAKEKTQKNHDKIIKLLAKNICVNKDFPTSLPSTTSLQSLENVEERMQLLE